jgi:phosphoribosylglycinamide formyltransferase 2
VKKYKSHEKNKMKNLNKIGTPYSQDETRVLLCGGGELGKEVAIEFQRLGVYVAVMDSYDNAPAMQVAHDKWVGDMLDPQELRAAIAKFKPHFIIPEVEAIATEVFTEVEQEGINVIPNARAVNLTMNREGIRTLAAETLGLNTSKYKFASNKEQFIDAVINKIGIPCIVKPIMSSSGKGQSTIKSAADIEPAWEYAQSGGRAGAGKVIVEEVVDFDYEITLLTVRHVNGTSFCQPIGHRQVDGDYIESWQPHPMTTQALESAEAIAKSITDALGGYGVFGVELFVKYEEVWFSEVSPRPHDTGLVTLISQDLSEFALHTRAILNLPIPNIVQHGTSASHVIKPEAQSDNVSFSNLDTALQQENTQIRLFGKPNINGKRRMGVAVCRDFDLRSARAKAKKVAESILVEL